MEQEDEDEVLGLFADIPRVEVEKGQPAPLPDHEWLNFPQRSGELTRGMMYGQMQSDHC